MIFSHSGVFFSSLRLALGATFIYLVQESPVFSPRPPWMTSRIQGTPDPEQYRIQPAFPSIRFENPSSIQEMSSVGRMLITEMAGK